MWIYVMHYKTSNYLYTISYINGLRVLCKDVFMVDLAVCLQVRISSELSFYYCVRTVQYR